MGLRPYDGQRSNGGGEAVSLPRECGNCFCELLFGKNNPSLKSGHGRCLIGHWQLQGIVSFMSDEPFTITSRASMLYARRTQQRADVVATPELLGEIADPSGGGLQCVRDWQAGTAGRCHAGNP